MIFPWVLPGAFDTEPTKYLYIYKLKDLSTFPVIQIYLGKIYLSEMEDWNSEFPVL